MISVNYEIRRQLGLLLAEEIRQRHFSDEEVARNSRTNLNVIHRMRRKQLVGWRQYNRVCKFLNCGVEVHLIKILEK